MKKDNKAVPIENGRKNFQGFLPPCKAENAGGPAPGKDDNAAGRQKSRQDESIFNRNSFKTLAWIFIATGCLALVAGILFALAVGGPAVPILTILSILLNSIGVTLLKPPKK